ALLKSMGIGTVINLRREDEDLGFDEAAESESLGLSYVNLPVGMDNLDLQTATQLRAILNQTAAPVYMHCGSGNRVGALYAIGAHLIDGKPLEESLDVGRKAGLTGLEPRVREILTNAEAAP
ncbi:MAG: sulfur transferase domain-containing protein, partial [Rhodospirillaceae bacterium]